VHLFTSNRGNSFPKMLGVACTFEVTTVTLDCCFLKLRRPGRPEGGPILFFAAPRALRTAVTSRESRVAENNSRWCEASWETIEAWGIFTLKRAFVGRCSVREMLWEHKASIEGPSTLGHDERLWSPLLSVSCE
jgi:hypothetical protein